MRIPRNWYVHTVNISSSSPSIHMIVNNCVCFATICMLVRIWSKMCSWDTNQTLLLDYILCLFEFFHRNVFFIFDFLH